jgi:drug/metabolite transporter (DMT)-like permease
MALTPLVTALVLCAALMHASWNALVKSDKDRLGSFGLVMLAGSLIGLAIAPFVPLPADAAWKWIAASTAIHVFYFFFLLRAYAHGDLSHVYPIARGLGPTLVAIFSDVLVGERVSLQEALGVGLVSLGIIGLALGNGWRGLGGRGTVFAVLTGMTIAAYTVADGTGVRSSGNALSYIVWLNIAQGPWVFVVALYLRRGALFSYLRRQWRRGSAGGVIATVGYGIAIWALSLGTMAHVAALRETSVLFAALIGTFLLGEPFGKRRIVAAGIIVAGLILMNLPPL